MKQLTLIKTSPTVQLSHLYEHIFCMQLEAFLGDSDIFPYLDYILMGKTYYGGMIYINIELYSDKAIALYDVISDLAIDPNDSAIITAIKQMIAEKEVIFSSAGYDYIKRELNDLHRQPWQNADELELIDKNSIRKKRGSLYIESNVTRAARKLTTSVLLNIDFVNEHRDILPLFRQFALLLNASMQYVLSGRYGYYSFDDIYKNNREVTGITNIFKVAYSEDIHVNISEILETCIEVVRNLQRSQVFVRYMGELRNVSYRNIYSPVPSIESNYEDTGILIGSKGWRKIAIQENYELIFQNMSVTVRFGRDKATYSLGDLSTV